MHLDAEDKHLFARVVEQLGLGADLGNGDPPRAEVARLIREHLVSRNNVQHIELNRHMHRPTRTVLTRGRTDRILTFDLEL